MRDEFFNSYYLIQSLRMAKFFFDIGLFDEALAGVTWLNADDYGELFLNGMQYLAPDFESEELGEDVCCGGHTLYRFGDPAIVEYYRLCRLYEYKHAITPEENPYVKKVDDYYSYCCNNACGYFGAGYDDDVNVRELLIETCPERCVDELDLLECIHNVLEYYRREVKTLERELIRGPMVWLPALPAPKGEIANENCSLRGDNCANQAA